MEAGDEQVFTSTDSSWSYAPPIFFPPLLHCHAQIRDYLVLLILGKIKFKSIYAAKKP